MLFRSFVETVETGVSSGRVPRPALATRTSRFTPVLGPLLANKLGVGDPDDAGGLEIARVLEDIAGGQIVDARSLLAALRKLSLRPGPRDIVGRLSNESDRGDAAKYGSMKGFAELADLLYENMAV